MKKAIIVTERTEFLRPEQPTEQQTELSEQPIAAEEEASKTPEQQTELPEQPIATEEGAKKEPTKAEEEQLDIETALEEASKTPGFLTAGELANSHPLIYSAIGGVISAVEGLPPLVLLGAAPPQGESWENIESAVKGGESFKLKVWLVSGPHSPKRKGRVLVYDKVLVAGEVDFYKRDRKIRIGDEEGYLYTGHLVTPESTVIKESEVVIPSWGRRRKRELLTPEEIEELREKFVEGEPKEEEEISLQELLEAEKRAEKEEEEKEKERIIEDAIARIGESKKLLKHVLLAKVADLVGRSVTPILQKARKKSEDDVEGAKRKLEEGLKALSEGDGLEALEDFATARFYLSDHDSYTKPLVNAFDDLMEIAWNAYKGRKYSKERARELVRRVLRLIENPRGERAEPPRRVDSPRDARLWEMAKLIVKDEYRDVEEDSEQFWQIVSRIFTRMKLRLGGAREEVVEKVVEELREKHGKLPKGAKTAKEIERLKEKHLRSRGD
jgi:hypothetical protein